MNKADLEIVVNPENPTASNKLELAETLGSDYALFCPKSSYRRKSHYFLSECIYIMTNWYLTGI